MAFVVTDNCIQCKYTDCVAVCPADAFHQGPNFLVINPESCIDCDLCPVECPAEAIYQEDEVPENQNEGWAAPLLDLSDFGFFAASAPLAG